MRRMQSLMVFLVLMAVCLSVLALKSQNRLARLKVDPLSKTRCDLVCLEVEKEKKAECRTQCKDQEVKPGSCPSSDNSKWAESCVEECVMDSQCDSIRRCCRYGCSAACRDPTDLLSLSGLPALPQIGEPIEKRHSIIIRWSDGVGDLARAVPGRVLYLLEEQHHLGPKYEEQRLGDWNLLLRTNRTKVSLRNLLKPGRWYRFRVAAVSAAGTRGYSAPSSPFTPRRGPRPPPSPKKLKVHPIRADNGTITVRLEWKEPRSDLPVIRYKVYWSRRVRGLQGGELDSVLVNHQTVSKEQTYYDITDLQPKSMYFFQVQTISQFGVGKLRSDKASIFYNTTNNNAHIPERLRKNRGKEIKGLKLLKLIMTNQGLRARITWNPIRSDGKPRRYFVRWEATRCDNKPQTKKKELSAITQLSVFEIYELEYRCNYRVNVNRSKSKNIADSEITVNVPDCMYFQNKANGTNLNCIK